MGARVRTRDLAWRLGSLLAVPLVALTADGQARTTSQTAVAPAASGVASAAVNTAFRAALAKVPVRDAVRREVLRQLGTRQPLGLVNGYWIQTVHMGAIYAVPIVRAELLRSLGNTGPQLLAAASGVPSGMRLAFTNAYLGRSILPNVVRDVEASLGAAAAAAHLTDIWDLVGDVLVGVGPLGVLLDVGATPGFLAGLVQSAREWSESGSSYDPNADIDGDGIMNWKDDDDDGDGVSDQNDNYPADPAKTICDCGRGRALAFGSAVPASALPGFVAAMNNLARQSARVSLGPAAAGQPGQFAIAF